MATHVSRGDKESGRLSLQAHSSSPCPKQVPDVLSQSEQKKASRALPQDKAGSEGIMRPVPPTCKSQIKGMPYCEACVLCASIPAPPPCSPRPGILEDCRDAIPKALEEGNTTSPAEGRRSPARIAQPQAVRNPLPGLGSAARSPPASALCSERRRLRGSCDKEPGRRPGVSMTSKRWGAAGPRRREAVTSRGGCALTRGSAPRTRARSGRRERHHA